MKEKIHDLKTALEVLRIQQTVSFDDCQKLMTDVHDKTGFTPPNFEISGNQWCALVNLAVARFGNTTPPPKEPEQEPAKWMYPDALCDRSCLYVCTKAFTQFPECATTPPQRTWVGLTDEEVMNSWNEIQNGDWAPDFYAVIEAKLKRKNSA